MEIENNQEDGRISKRGGARKGAGRKPGDIRQKWYSARGIAPLKAAEVLAQCCDERKVWTRLLASDDDRIVLQSMMFLASMRDGKPAQQINITQQTLTLSGDDIMRARAIVAEIRGGALALPSAIAETEQPTEANAPADAGDESEQTGHNAAGDEGGKKGG